MSGLHDTGNGENKLALLRDFWILSSTLLIDEKIGTPCKNYRPTASRCELMIRLVKANYGLSCESFHSSLLIERSQGLKTSAISAKLSWILMTIASRVLYICVTFWLLAHTVPYRLLSAAFPKIITALKSHMTCYNLN